MSSGIHVLITLLLALALCWAGKWAYGVFHPEARVDAEVTAKDNLAFALPLGSYYLGILIVIGGPLSGGAQRGLLSDSLAVIGWGLLAILLLNLASLVKHHLLFRRIDLQAEIADRRNVAAGIVSSGLHLANALLILGALTGEGGLLPAAVFWVYGQVLLALATLVFLHLTHDRLGQEILRGNRAAGLSVAGLLVAMGNVLRLAIGGSFEGWAAGFAAATGYTLSGLALLFAVRWLVDWLLLPGVTIRQEIFEAEVPNTGVGYLEAVFYLGASLLIGWTL
jgi:uncharacterized membrane protein YjfL (UPF0719 family)